VLRDPGETPAGQEGDHTVEVLLEGSHGNRLYDAFGRRVAKSSDSSYYFYDQGGRLLARREDDAGGDHLRSYVYAEDELVGFVDLVESPPGGCAGLPAVGHELGLPDFWWLMVPAAAFFVLLVPGLRRRPIAATGVVTIALVVGAASIARSGIVSVAFFWVHTDHLGTPLAVTDRPANPANATVVWRAIYEAFGKATVDEDPDADQVPVSLNVRFPGQYYDAESGLHYNYHRYYDPGIGRYISNDRMGSFGIFFLKGLWKSELASLLLGIDPPLTSREAQPDPSGVATDAMNQILRSPIVPTNAQSDRDMKIGNRNPFTYLDGDPMNWVDSTGEFKANPFSNVKNILKCGKGLLDCDEDVREECQNRCEQGEFRGSMAACVTKKCFPKLSACLKLAVPGG